MANNGKNKKDKTVFPQDPNKTYGLVEFVKGTRPTVDKGPDDTQMVWPHLLMRLLVLFIVLLLVLSVLSFFFNAPLEERVSPTHPPNPAKAPWYFLGLQEMVSYSAFIGGILIPTLVVLVLLAVPYIDRKPVGVGVWFSKERLMPNILFGVFVILVVVLTAIGLYFRGEFWNFVVPWGK